jgi:hypothetical protein
MPEFQVSYLHTIFGAVPSIDAVLPGAWAGSDRAATGFDFSAEIAQDTNLAMIDIQGLYSYTNTLGEPVPVLLCENNLASACYLNLTLWAASPSGGRGVRAYSGFFQLLNASVPSDAALFQRLYDRYDAVSARNTVPDFVQISPALVFSPLCLFDECTGVSLAVDAFYWWMAGGDGPLADCNIEVPTLPYADNPRFPGLATLTVGCTSAADGAAATVLPDLAMSGSALALQQLIAGNLAGNVSRATIGAIMSFPTNELVFLALNGSALLAALETIVSYVDTQTATA